MGLGLVDIRLHIQRLLLRTGWREEVESRGEERRGVRKKRDSNCSIVREYLILVCVYVREREQKQARETGRLRVFLIECLGGQAGCWCGVMDRSTL